MNRHSSPLSIDSKSFSFGAVEEDALRRRIAEFATVNVRFWRNRDLPLGSRKVRFQGTGAIGLGDQLGREAAVAIGDSRPAAFGPECGRFYRLYLTTKADINDASTHFVVGLEWPGHPKVPAPSIRFGDHRCLSASQASGTPIPCAMIRAVARESWENMHDLAAWHVIQVFVRQFAYSGAQTLSIVFGICCLRGIAAPGAPSGAH
jgi:hypothetical protein